MTGHTSHLKRLMQNDLFAMPWLIAIGANLNTCHRFNFQVEKHRFFSPNISELPVYLAPQLKYLINKNCNNIMTIILSIYLFVSNFKLYLNYELSK